MQKIRKLKIGSKLEIINYFQTDDLKKNYYEILIIIKCETFFKFMSFKDL